MILWFTPIPRLITVFVALFALLPALALKSLWTGGGERVWVEQDEIVSQPVSGPIRRIGAANVSGIEMHKTVGVGAVSFHRITAAHPPPPGRRFARRREIVAMVRGEEAAREVIAWIQERLAR